MQQWPTSALHHFLSEPRGTGGVIAGPEHGEGAPFFHLVGGPLAPQPVEHGHPGAELGQGMGKLSHVPAQAADHVRRILGGQHEDVHGEPLLPTSGERC